MKKQINPTIKAHLVRSAFYLLLLLGVCAIPFALAQRNSPRTNRQQTQPVFQAVNPYTGRPVVAGPVTVTATCGVMGPTDYPTLKAAFDAINAGTHQCDITIDIVFGTDEGSTPATLNGSGAGAASYTSVLIRPVNDDVSINGSPASGLGVIQLNGASNVTIDGDNPNTAGINRNLTIRNVAVSTQTFGQVIRIALATSGNDHADDDTIKNLYLFGNATGRNVSGATSTSGSENTTYGILAGGGASTTAGATPAPITSVSTTIASPATANNLTIQNNYINTAARAIAVQGGSIISGPVFPNLLIEDNSIGTIVHANSGPDAPRVGQPNQVYSVGITAQGSGTTGTDIGTIRRNSIYMEGWVASSAAGNANHAIGIGTVSGTGTYTVEQNLIFGFHNNNPDSWAAVGINIGGGNNHVVQNNFVGDIVNDQTTGTGAFGTSFGAYGIRVAGGTGHKIYFNSVSLFGQLPGSTSTDLTAAFMIVNTAQTGMDVRNNLFSNQLTGGNPVGTNTRHAAVYLPSGGTSAMNLTWNNNGYYQGPATTGALSLLAQRGTTAGTGQFFAADFDPAGFADPANLRTYTNTLMVAFGNDNASFGLAQVPPLLDLDFPQIPPGAMTQLARGAANGTGVTDDIDGDPRNPIAPDIGADEFSLDCQFHVLIVYADSSAPTLLQSEIQAQPTIGVVDFFDAFAGTPTLAQLQQYDIVVPLDNLALADPVMLGNNLADYVDSGGLVVQCGFTFLNNTVGITGRWLTDHYNTYDYSALLIPSVPYMLGTYNAAAPLMTGVTTLNGLFGNRVTPATGATEVAQTVDQFDERFSLIAYRPINGGHTTVGVTGYLGNGSSQSGDWGKVIANAGNWLIACTPAPTGTPTPTPSPTAIPASCPFHVLIVYSDTAAPANLQSEILAQPNVAAVDLFDASIATPTLAQLQQYEIVVPFSSLQFFNSTALGNNLADYVDGGGVVVQYGFAFVGPQSAFGINGRWVTDGYNPYTYSDNPLSHVAFTLGSFNAAHPLMAGVTILNSNQQNVVLLAANTTQVAATSNGHSLVAYRRVSGGHTTVGVTAYVGASAAQSGDWGKVIVNAGNWLLVCGSTPTPSPTPTATATASATATATVPPTPTPSPTATATATATASPTVTATATATATFTPTATATFTPSATATFTPTPTATATFTPTATATATATATFTPTPTPTPTVTVPPRQSPTPRPRPTPAPRP